MADDGHTDGGDGLLGAVGSSGADGAARLDEDVVRGFRWLGGEVRGGGDADETGDESIREAVVGDAIEYFEAAESDWPGVGRPAEAFVRDRFFDFAYLSGAEEVERYWLDRPYSYASILYDVDSRTNYYHVSEPVLDEEEAYVRADLKRYLRDVLEWETVRDGGPAAFEREVRRHAAEFAPSIPDGSLRKIGYYLLRDFTGYGRLDPMMVDDRIEDVSCDGHDIPVFVYHRQYRDLPSNVVFAEPELDSFIRWLAQRTGHPISYANPVVSATLPRGDRAQLILGSDVSVRGSNFTIRRFQAVPLTPVDLVRLNTFSTMEMAYLWLCIEHQKSVVFVGPTASGKTTSMNAVSMFIRPYAKVVTIERTRELSIPHDNWVSTVTRETDRRAEGHDVTVYDLLHSALHQRPEYIIVGEIRTEPEVLRTFLQSVFTGHAGYTTFHAYDVEEAIGRFRAEPFDAEDNMIASIDIVSVQRQVYIDDERLRRTVRIAELNRDEAGDLQTTEAFAWNPTTDTHESRGDLFELPALREIAEEHGWTEVELGEELDRRREVLNYLLRNDVTDHRDVWAAVFAFSRDREATMAAIDDGTFDPAAVEINYYD